MNSNYGKSNTKSSSFNNFDLDLGINSSRSRPLNEQKKPANSYSSTSTYTTSYASKPGATAYKPSWTHQPADQSQTVRVGSLSGPASMAGDIFGKSWTSSTPAVSSAGGVGIPKKDPALFGDLVSSALGQNKGNSNVPLKNVAPAGNSNVPLKNSAPLGNKSSFSMGNMADSFPSKDSSTNSARNWGSAESFGGFTSGFSTNTGIGATMNPSGSANKSGNVGGASLKNMAGGGKGLNHDPFGSLVDFRSKGSGSISSNHGTEGSSKKNDANDDAFMDFQEAPKKNTKNFSAGSFTSGTNGSTGSTTGPSYSNFDDFTNFPSRQPKSEPSVESAGLNAFEALFTSTGGTAKGSQGVSSQQFSVVDDWGVDPMSEGGNDQGGTTELEGLPPPPAGVSASTAKDKGLAYKNQGQYADAIKWLSWAVILFEKAADDNGIIEVLSCRASCFKENGENKKAVADCSKVLEKDGANISVLVQRALLYESMEKYKLGAEDLRTVMKYDPGNRVAKSTIHRLVKMSE